MYALPTRVGIFTVEFGVTAAMAVETNLVPRDLGEVRTSIRDAENRFALASELTKLMSTANTSEVATLATDEDPTLALAAGWERVRREMGSKQFRVTVHASAAQRFLGLVEGRVQSPPPSIWEKAILECQWEAGPRTVFPTELTAELENYRKASADGNDWLIVVDGVSLRVPINAPGSTRPIPFYYQANPKDGPYYSAVMEQNAVYVTFFTWPPSTAPIVAMDRNTQTQLWRSEVWEYWQYMNYSGYGYVLSNIQLTDDTVVVYGVDDSCAFVSAFNKEDGKAVLRFSTANHHIAGDPFGL